MNMGVLSMDEHDDAWQDGYEQGLEEGRNQGSEEGLALRISIEDAFRSGEYDQGDVVLISYDELVDLVEQANSFVRGLFTDGCGTGGMATLRALERRWNRPLHPVLGGKSPYSEFLPI